MDEEGFFAVGFLDVFVGHARLEIEDIVGVGAEGFEDAVDFGVLNLYLVSARMDDLKL